MKCFFLSVSILIAALTGPAQAIDPGERLDDPALEARARNLSQELRCLVCQNESIDGSDAPLARDLRILVRERLSVGETDDEVMDFIVARYGEFVLLRPRFHVQTWTLWIAPFAILFVGGVGVFFVLRSRDRASITVPPLSDEEKSRLAEIMSKHDQS